MEQADVVHLQQPKQQTRAVCYLSLTAGGYCERSYTFSSRCLSGMEQVKPSSTLPVV
jgi:hypothetical protein